VPCSVGDQRVNVVANLPYNITKSVLRQMLPLGDSFSHLHFMLQVRAAASSLT
jgi:16S rRNA A1518/A1519 N6-dimethyltransferase RsmA/KsgA/DIM1 with predicted DNA glycosylase/AP lyase activity